MISPINSFDVGAVQSGRESGLQIGAANSPLTPLGAALRGTLDTYNKHLTLQQEQANAMALQNSKNINDMAIAKIGAGYAPDGSAPLPEVTPEVVWTEGPNGEPMYATKKSKGGRIVQSDFAYAPRPESMKSQLENKALGPIVENWGKTSPAPVAPIPAAQPTQTERIKVRDPKGNIGTIPAGQFNDAMKQGYQRI